VVTAAVWLVFGLGFKVLGLVPRHRTIVAMNVMELTLARDYLLAPIPMLFANAAFLTAGWICALRAPAQTKGS